MHALRVTEADGQLDIVCLGHQRRWGGFGRVGGGEQSSKSDRDHIPPRAPTIQEEHRTWCWSCRWTLNPLTLPAGSAEERVFQ